MKERNKERNPKKKMKAALNEINFHFYAQY